MLLFLHPWLGCNILFFKVYVPHLVLVCGCLRIHSHTQRMTPQQCGTPCVAGYYCPVNAASTQAFVCPAGSACPANATAAQPCPVGRYSAVGASVCADCTSLPGYGCAAGSTSAAGTVCGAGRYGAGGNAACANCSAGYFGNSTGLR